LEPALEECPLALEGETGVATEAQARDLIGRLEVVDDDRASALRVIDHFDRLVDEKASKAAVVRAVR